MHIKIFIILMIAFVFVTTPASAETVLADFEGPSNNGFQLGSGYFAAYQTTCYEGFHGYMVGSRSGVSWAYKDIDVSSYDTLSFYACLNGHWNKGGENGKISIGEQYIDIIRGVGPWSTWTKYNVDVSNLIGVHRFYINVTFVSYTNAYIHFDYLTADVIPSEITWTTYPAYSWVKGNYSTLVVSVPDTLEFDFYYKNPSNDDYVLTPIQKSSFGRYYNASEGCFYQDYIKTCYHAVHGNYSAKLQINGIDSSVTTRYIPYINLEVDLPEIIIIPIPDVYVDPPQWNVTLPPKYDNVSWLVDYTTFWDGVGNSINHTQYATVGLLLIPFETLNNSMSVIYEHANGASTMLQGFEHCSIIVMSGWDLIPIEIQTLFIGAATLGAVIFILHRRA